VPRARLRLRLTADQPRAACSAPQTGLRPLVYTASGQRAEKTHTSAPNRRTRARRTDADERAEETRSQGMRVARRVAALAYQMTSPGALERPLFSCTRRSAFAAASSAPCFLRRLTMSAQAAGRRSSRGARRKIGSLVTPSLLLYGRRSSRGARRSGGGSTASTRPRAPPSRRRCSLVCLCGCVCVCERERATVEKKLPWVCV
jgi:hypothetical protein